MEDNKRRENLKLFAKTYKTQNNILDDINNDTNLLTTNCNQKVLNKLYILNSLPCILCISNIKE